MLLTPTMRELSRDTRRRLIGFDTWRRGTDLILLDGPAYIGKTTALLAAGRQVEQQVARLRPDYRLCGEVPVVHVDMTSKATPKTVAGAILDFFQTPYKPTEKHERLASQAVNCLIARHTRLLIVDELQMLHLQGRSGDDSINALKTIINHAGVLPVLAGINLRTLLTSNAADQLMARGREPHVAEPFSNATVEDRDAWDALLDALGDEMFLLDGRPSLSRHGDVLFKNTDGSIGKLRYLLEFILTTFVEQRHFEGEDVPETITAGLIQQAAPVAMSHVDVLEKRRTAAPGRDGRSAA